MNEIFRPAENIKINSSLKLKDSFQKTSTGQCSFFTLDLLFGTVF